MSRVALAAVLVMLLAFRAGACSRTVPLPVRTGRSFRVQVTNRESPVARLRVQLNHDESELSPLFVATTNDKGFAQFAGIPEGIYYLTASHDLEPQSLASVEVVKDVPDSVTVPFGWPSRTPIRVRTASGVLHDAPNHKLSSISLVDGMSGRVLQTTRGNQNGEFAFDTPKDGLYFVILEPPGAFAGLSLGDGIAIEVEKGASEEKLDLDLRWSDCGVHYVDENEIKGTDHRDVSVR